MPSAGLQMFGAGLQLQQVTPGTQNVGNFNLGGVGIAGQFTTCPTGAGGAANLYETFGHQITRNGIPNAAQNIFGTALTTGTQSQVALYGYNSSCYSGQSAVFGQSNIAGYPGDANARKVALGGECSAGTDVGAPSVQAAVGVLVSVTGTTNTVGFGANVSLKGAQAGQPQVAFGSNIQAAQNATNVENAFFGIGIIPGLAKVQNALVMGVYDATGASGAFPGVGSNQVLIGNAAQTSVKIGAYSINQSIGATTKIGDANYAIQPTDGVVMMTAITAPRTWTLPAANSVPAGYIIRLIDMSGSVTGVNNITISPSGADTINGPGTPAINTAYGANRLMSDGVSKWVDNNQF